MKKKKMMKEKKKEEKKMKEKKKMKKKKKKKRERKKRLKVSNFVLLLVVFKVTSWQLLQLHRTNKTAAVTLTKVSPKR